MEYKEFIELTKYNTPPDNLEGVYLALWYAVKDNWYMKKLPRILILFSGFMHIYTE